MQLFFLRHGIAEDRHSTGSDAERPLTEAGRQQLAVVARAMQRLAIRPTSVYASPLVRTQQTAEIVVAVLGGTLMLTPELAPGCTFDQLQPLLRQASDDQMLLVGHAPDMGSLVAALIGAGGRAIRVAKAGLAGVEYDGRPRQGSATLRYLLTPQQLEWIGSATK
ncbi:MAG: phosphohistidine phosphatase SixA [Herpetosiphonaceae bacterium]|nr:phosphohistidine phosphatase SixA [Herpetosiphonaceae bacterium]